MRRTLAARSRNSGVGLQVDLPGAAELVEIVHIVAAQVGLQGVEDVAERNARPLALGAIDVDEELRRVGAEHAEYADQPRLPVGGRRQAVGLVLQVARPSLPTSWTIVLKPPALPTPSTAGAENRHLASLIFP